MGNIDNEDEIAEDEVVEFKEDEDEDEDTDMHPGLDFLDPMDDDDEDESEDEDAEWDESWDEDEDGEVPEDEEDE